MQFSKILPSESLRPYISCFWLIEDCYNNVADISFPDGCIELVFSVGLEVDRMEIDGSHRRGHWAEIIGQMTRPYQVKVNGDGKVFGVRFFPHAFANFFPDTISSINDKSVQVDHVLGNKLGDVIGSYLYDGRIIEAISIIEQSLIRRLAQNSQNRSRNKIVEHAVRCIFRDGLDLDLNNIAQQCNVSVRTLQRKFRESVGISPKYFARVIRFQQSLFHLRQRSDSITTIGYKLGFFDQAHFIHEFKAFSGLTPSSFHVDLHPVNKHFISGSENFM